METIFNKSKLKPLIKFNGYKYLGNHPIYNDTNYYIRKYDNHNNYEFMEAKIGAFKKGLRNKYTLIAGTNIKILDAFMFSYLKHRKEFIDGKVPARIKSRDFVKFSLNENGFVGDKMIDLYSNKVPTEIAKSEYYQSLIKSGFDVLYVRNTEVLNKQFNTVSLVMYQEIKQEALGANLSYVVFKTTEFATKPSFTKGEGKEKYAKVEESTLAVPVEILK